ncbi:hypothetical protein HC256_004130 [Beauveria bassiana]|nr:hypothetical protein HC256_006712 [Beauveria bassiana]KAH8715294.1 hypothetical protein HC256_004130 [Beauveria bassiana]
MCMQRATQNTLALYEAAIRELDLSTNVRLPSLDIDPESALGKRSAAAILGDLRDDPNAPRVAYTDDEWTVRK